MKSLGSRKILASSGSLHLYLEPEKSKITRQLSRTKKLASAMKKLGPHNSIVPIILKLIKLNKARASTQITASQPCSREGLFLIFSVFLPLQIDYTKTRK